MPHQVFISHSTKDKSAALSVCTSLEKSGVRCWIAPRDIVAGMKWAAAIADAIENSSAIILILTKSSNDSSNVADEVNLAKKFDVPIVSVRAEDVEPAKHLALFLTSSHWFEAHTPPLDDHLDRLVSNLRQLVVPGLHSSGSEVSTRDTKKQLDTAKVLPAADSSLHRELLFGVVAAQFEFITQQQFLSVCAEWCTTKNRSLGKMLVERNWIEEADRVAIEALHKRKLAKHQGNAPAALWASSDGMMRDVIRQSEAPEVCRSLDGLGRQPSSDGGDHPFDEISRQSRYQWTRLHRAGGLGHIWIADDTELGRPVAIKMLPPDRESSEAERMLLNEARIASRLEHPNIVPIYEVGRREEDDKPFYAMRLLRGETLTDAVEKFHSDRSEGKLDPVERRRLLNVFFDVCNAVAYAHSQGVFHLDLKPDNVIVGMFNEVNLLDWGLAQESGIRQDAGQQPRGTPAYMSPEQAVNDIARIGSRTDVYGLGTILFEILAGRPPHVGHDTQELLRRIATQPSPSPGDVVDNAPESLIEICQKAMATDPAKRFDSALELGEQVQSFLRDEPLEAYRGAVKKARTLCEKNPDSEAYRDNLARTLMNLGVVLDGMERYDEAERGLADAIEQHQWLKEHFADNLQYRINFAAACLQRRTALSALGRKNEAEQMSRDALWEYEDIIRKSPKRDDFVSIYASVMLDDGVTEEVVNKKVDAIAHGVENESSVSLSAPDCDTIARPVDRWLVPDSLHALLFATAAIRDGVIGIEHLHDAVHKMLNNQSMPLDKQLISAGILDKESQKQVYSSVREMIRASDIAPRIAPRVSTVYPSGYCQADNDPQTLNALESVYLTTGMIPPSAESGLDPRHFTGIERFEIIRTLGQGGMGRVSLARDLEAYRLVAVKELKEEAMSEHGRKRFLFEARFAASLRVTLPVYAIGQFPDGRPFYAMHYLTGHSIDRLLKNSREGGETTMTFSLADAVRALANVARSLDHAHHCGFIHRDVKPGNIFVDQRGDTFLVDWGLVKCFAAARTNDDPLLSALCADAELGEQGVCGTPAFMSPEHVLGDDQRMGPAADIYCLGATLYYILTDRPPHGIDYTDLTSLVSKIRKGEIKPPSEVAGDRHIPDELQTICMRALATRPEQRFASADEFSQALEHWLMMQSQADGPATRLAKWIDRSFHGG